MELQEPKMPFVGVTLSPMSFSPSQAAPGSHHLARWYHAGGGDTGKITEETKTCPTDLQLQVSWLWHTPCQMKKALVCQWNDVRQFHSLISCPPCGRWRPILPWLIEGPRFAKTAFVASPGKGPRVPSPSPCKLLGAAHGGNLSQEPPQPLFSFLMLFDTSCF